MTAADTLAAALEREHCEIDEWIEAFLASRADSQGFVMLREHGEIWGAMETIEAQLGAGGGDGPLAASSERPLGHLERHNAKEELVDYQQADAVLTAGLREFLFVDRLPVGWVCACAKTGERQ